MCMGIFLNGGFLLLLFKSNAHKHRLKHISLHTKTLKTTSSAAKITPKRLYVQYITVGQSEAWEEINY